MHKLYDLKEKLIKELEGYADNGKYSKDDVESIKYIASAVDHICNIVDEADGEYSGRMYYDDGTGGSMRSYRRGGSYARGGRGNRGGNQRRYSGDGIVDQLEELMEEAPDERTRMEMQKFISKIQNMS